MSERSGVRSPATAWIFYFAASSWLFFSRDCVNILRNISCPIYSILFLFPRARKTRIIPFLFYATPPRIEARRIERISGILGHGQGRGGRGRVDFQLAVRFTRGATVGKTPVYCMKMAKCAQYSTVQYCAHHACIGCSIQNV